MKITYDISILGQGHANPKARTGIYRMVESLLTEIIKVENLDFKLVALNKNSSYWDSLAAEIYLESIDSYDFFYSYYPANFSVFFYKSLIRNYRLILQSNMGKKNFVYKMAQFIKILSESIDKKSTKIDLTYQDFSLYHSTYFPLPLLPQQTTRLLTIYDLIPQIFPDFVTPKVLKRGLEILDSVDITKDWIICISEHTKQDFCQYTGMNPERVFVTPLAASDNFYPVTDSPLIAQTQKKYHIPPEPYLLSLCTLEPRKNLKFLLQSYAQLLEQDQTIAINLVLVGVSGWKNNDIFQTIQNHPLLKKRVIVTGYIPDQDLSAIYSGALAFVYPSLYEGFGLPPLEAMQCGTPVITSNTSSLPEVVGDAGIMIDPNDQDQLSQAMLNLINSSTLRYELSQKGLIRAKQFNWEKCAAQTVEIYHQIHHA
ncbi:MULTISPECIES: glycosyltransferase family 1 protein [unclassified Synechocystis]|uniref:glycosyltransferase family 4 protein n=1 Tax=unclassified Synechocystis TaxID=2640012 RepID=UPI0004264834|nr:MULTISPECIES: glycosyltransferase family 1 protein [unclassified Synechocystis]AIE74134.1 Glycosyl transferase, group 1 [Synechocystis sp. PCC 6714]MCT0252773.1 glycosyltransferase family 4 protein [Synechocystis sp. CS-94]